MIWSRSAARSTHKKGLNTQRLDVEIPRKKAPNCKGSPSISQMKDFEFESS